MLMFSLELEFNFVAAILWRYKNNKTVVKHISVFVSFKHNIQYLKISEAFISKCLYFYSLTVQCEYVL